MYVTIGAYGITPAYAGKSANTDAERANHEDHPRLRGEKKLMFPPFLLIWGSPPLTRGKVVLPDAERKEMRITPAYAGKSSTAG